MDMIYVVSYTGHTIAAFTELSDAIAYRDKSIKDLREAISKRNTAFTFDFGSGMLCRICNGVIRQADTLEAYFNLENVPFNGGEIK